MANMLSSMLRESRARRTYRYAQCGKEIGQGKTYYYKGSMPRGRGKRSDVQHFCYFCVWGNEHPEPEADGHPTLFNHLWVADVPSILLQAVVLVGEKTTEGRLIEAVGPAWKEIVRFTKEDPSFLFKIDPRKLEELIAGAYQKAGFTEVVLTPRSGDFGRDVIATRKDWGQARIIDQVKAYKPGHLVTAEEIRAWLAQQADRNATKGFVTTTSDFAPRIGGDPFIKPYMPYRIELINGDGLRKRLNELI